MSSTIKEEEAFTLHTDCDKINMEDIQLIKNVENIKNIEYYAKIYNNGNIKWDDDNDDDDDDDESEDDEDEDEDEDGESKGIIVPFVKNNIIASFVNLYNTSNKTDYLIIGGIIGSFVLFYPIRKQECISSSSIGYNYKYLIGPSLAYRFITNLYNSTTGINFRYKYFE